MKMKLMMEQKQMLKMVMTTELRQAIELLQLSSYELFQFIQDKAEENPFIELIEKENPSISNHQYRQKQPFRQDVDPLANAVQQEKGMHEELLDQLIDIPLEREQADIVHYLILNIDEHGFASISDEEVCANLQVTMEAVNSARQVLMKLEPLGIGARNLLDCLCIQAKEMYPDHQLLFTVIEDHFQSLADKRWNQIAKQLDVSLQDVQEVFHQIQQLNPRPAMKFAMDKADYINPDITIEWDEKKTAHTIQLHEHYIPNLRFNHEYSVQLNQSKELSEYVNHQYRQFEWLQNSIEQRRSTILKIMDVIVRHQQQFLSKGFRFLKPLTLKQVADEIEMHESTVSRATANKIIQTPVGIFELRHLFSTKITSTNGDQSSQSEVKEIIKEYVEKEDKFKPLSDQKIADLLKADHQITISRRTVAKYRDELFILSSSKRKEIKIKV